MPYPKELLPRRRYHNFSVSDLIPPSYIARRSLRQFGDYLDSLGEIRVDAVAKATEDVFGLSSFLLGAFLPAHAKIVVNEKEQPYWHPGTRVLKPREISFQILECPIIYFCVQDLHNRDFPYEKIIHDEVKQFSGTCRLLHRPTIFNFWHLEFVVFDESQEEIIRDSRPWKKKAAAFILKSFLKINAMTSLPDFEKIPKRVYTSSWIKNIFLKLVSISGRQ